MGLTGSGTMGDGLTNGGCFTGPTNKQSYTNENSAKTAMCQRQSNRALKALLPAEWGSSKGG